MTTSKPHGAMPELPVVAALHRNKEGTFFLKYEGDEQIYNVAMRNSPLSKAIDAYARAAVEQAVAVPEGQPELSMSMFASREDFEAESLARRFHEAYERLAPSFGYATRTDTKEF